jgi:hypothetical protein
MMNANLDDFPVLPAPKKSSKMRVISGMIGCSHMRERRDGCQAWKTHLSMLFCALFLELDLAPKKDNESRSSWAVATASLDAAATMGGAMDNFLPSIISICGVRVKEGYSEW